MIEARDSKVKELMENETHAVKVREEIKSDLEKTRQERDKRALEVKDRERVIEEQKAQIEKKEREI